jgi:energy-coupling factor transport system ATP-binding protein
MICRADTLGLSIGVRETPVFDGQSFALSAGDTGLITGPAGSGKTLLGLACCGYLPLWTGSWSLAGSIELFDSTVTQGAPSADTAVILENPYTQLSGLKRTVREELAFPLESRGITRDAMHETIARWSDCLGISHLLDREVRRCSGGELQRVLIAATLSTGPRFIFLDRPMTELDRTFRPRLLELLRDYLTDVNGAALMAEDPWLLPEMTDAPRIALGDSADNVDDTYSVSVRSALSSGNDIALTLDGVFFSHDPAEPLISECSFSVGRGELVFLTGPNGAGKSTLAALVIGMLSPDCGRIMVGGVPADDLHERERYTRIGYLFQNPGLHLCRQTVRDEIALAARWGTPVDDVVDMLGLDHCMDQHPFELTMAERKRLAAALACGGTRDTVLLDEPSQYQDTAGFEALNDMIDHRREHGAGIVVITHDERYFSAYPDARIIRLSRADTP